MAAINLSGGVVRSITRNAPRVSSEPNASPTKLTMLEKMALLRFVAENPPDTLGGFIDQIRSEPDTAADAIFVRLQSLVQAGTLESTELAA